MRGYTEFMKVFLLLLLVPTLSHAGAREITCTGKIFSADWYGKPFFPMGDVGVLDRRSGQTILLDGVRHTSEGGVYSVFMKDDSGTVEGRYVHTAGEGGVLTISVDGVAVEESIPCGG